MRFTKIRFTVTNFLYKFFLTVLRVQNFFFKNIFSIFFFQTNRLQLTLQRLQQLLYLLVADRIVLYLLTTNYLQPENCYFLGRCFSMNLCWVLQSIINLTVN